MRNVGEEKLGGLKKGLPGEGRQSDKRRNFVGRELKERKGLISPRRSYGRKKKKSHGTPKITTGGENTH